MIARGVGGVLDTVRDGETGVLYEDAAVDGLIAAIRRFEGLSFDEKVLRSHARKYGHGSFQESFTEFLQGTVPATTIERGP